MMPYQQSYEIKNVMQSINVNFIGLDRQFAFMEISLDMIKLINIKLFTIVTMLRSLLQKFSLFKLKMVQFL